MAHTHSLLLVHFVWSTKNREPWLTADVRPRLFAYMAGIFANNDAKALVIGGVENHVHALCRMKPKACPSELMKTVKGDSSAWFHATFRRPTFSWQEGYGAFSVSPTHRQAVFEYIEQQEEHHRHKTFEEEYLDFLRRYEIEHDERFVFD